MVLRGASKYPLTSRFHARYGTKHSDVSSATSSCDGYDEDDINPMNYDHAILIEQRNTFNQSEAGRGAYNFDALKVELGDGIEKPTMLLLPIPLPAIETSPSQALEDTLIETNDKSLIGNISNLRYRWNNIRSQFSFTKAQDEIDKEVFDSESDISQTSSDAQYHSMSEIDDNDGMSLLHGRTMNKVSTFFKPSILQRTTLCNNGLSITPLAKRTGRVNSGESEDQCECLISDKNDICDDWLNRQLAFDLEYLEDINISTAAGIDLSVISEEPYWILQLDDIPPPPPPIALKRKNSRKKSHLFCDEDFMEANDDSSDKPSQDLLDLHSSTTSSSNSSHISEKFVLQQKSWQDFDEEIRTKSASNRKNKKQYHTMVVARNQLGKYNTSREKRRRGSSSSRMLKYGRRRSGRHSPPRMLGRQFSTNLSTVTERPSEEEATSSYIPTPMSCNNRHFFENYDSDSSSNQSKEGTAETCSSKDSST